MIWVWLEYPWGVALGVSMTWSIGEAVQRWRNPWKLGPKLPRVRGL